MSRDVLTLLEKQHKELMIVLLQIGNQIQEIKKGINGIHSLSLLKIKQPFFTRLKAKINLFLKKFKKEKLAFDENDWPVPVNG